MLKQSNLDQKNLNQKKQKFTDYARYTSIASQMIITMLAGVFGGMWLDKQLHWKFPVFTLVLTIVSVILSIYFAIKDFIQPKP